MAAVKVFNNFILSLNTKQHCAALFIDLSKELDLVDHSLLMHRLFRAALSAGLKII